MNHEELRKLGAGVQVMLTPNVIDIDSLLERIANRLPPGVQFHSYSDEDEHHGRWSALEILLRSDAFLRRNHCHQTTKNCERWLRVRKKFSTATKKTLMLCQLAPKFMRT